jgi:pseudaminic acid cytidylyltransferase
MKSVCVIPARGGSKRIPRKNIKDFHGKPLICWSIETALKSGLFESVYVSTDDAEIADIASDWGAKIPFLRPAELSNDYAGDREVREHFIKWMKNNGLSFDVLCYLYATAPFLTTDTLRSCHKKIIDSNAMSVQTITNYPYPVLRSFKKDAEDGLTFMWEEYRYCRSQDLPELVHDAGQCYFFNLQQYQTGKGKTIGHQIPRTHCQDIDTEEDLAIAKKLFEIEMPERIANKPRNE